MNNVVVLVGRLAADAELRYLDSGKPVANFAVAVNRSIRKPDGSFEDSLDGFFDCELFGGQALALAEDLGKGFEVYLVGHLVQQKFTTKGGQKVSKVVVRVSKIGPALPARESEAASTAAAEPVAQPA